MNLCRVKFCCKDSTYYINSLFTDRRRLIMSESSTDFGSSAQRLKHSGSPPAACSGTSTAVRLQPVRATVPFQLLRGDQHSPTRSVSSSSSSSSSAGSNAGPTTSRCSSPANPGGSGSDGRLVRRQTVSPPDSRSSPDRSIYSPPFRGKIGIFGSHA